MYYIIENGKSPAKAGLFRQSEKPDCDSQAFTIHLCCHKIRTTRFNKNISNHISQQSRNFQESCVSFLNLLCPKYIYHFSSDAFIYEVNDSCNEFFIRWFSVIHPDGTFEIAVRHLIIRSIEDVFAQVSDSSFYP